MKPEIKKLYPKWVNDCENEYALCITNDIDSLFSAAVIQQRIKSEIYYFYDFKQLYKIENTYKVKKENVITVDCALEGNRKCWDNHVTLFTPTDKPNPNSANINNILGINRQNYFQKYCMGTHLQVVSYYEALDFSTLSDEQKLALWAIDASYKGYYSKYQNDRQAHRRYVELFELEGLVEVLDRYRLSDIIEVMKEYKLDGSIYVNDNGHLETNIKLDKLQGLFTQYKLRLPEQSFKGTVILTPEYAKLDENETYSKEGVTGVFSLALTGRNAICYTKYT